MRQYTNAWRWVCIKKYRSLIESHTLDPTQNGIDFGGYKGPIGGCTRIIDIMLKNSIYDEPYNSLDYIFTSHTLEHVNDINITLRWMYEILKEGGKLIIHVPAYTATRWRPENHTEHNYALSIDGHDTDIKEILERIGFKILIAEYCNKSIFIYTEKPNTDKKGE